MAPAVGFGLRAENRALMQKLQRNAAIEITAEHADDPLRVERFLGGVEPAYVSIHALELSPASPVGPPEEYLNTVATIAQENDADAISDHLGFTRDSNGKHGMGHFAPPPFTEEALQATRHNLDIICKRLAPTPFYLENIAYFFPLPGSMPEATFLRRVLQDSGCGWLLDVTNVYANALNHKYDPYAFIDEVMPAACSVQMHLAGGYMDRKANFYMDSHSEPIPEPVWKLFAHALRRGRGKVTAAFIERDDNHPDEKGWMDEFEHARRIVADVENER